MTDTPDDDKRWDEGLRFLADAEALMPDHSVPTCNTCMYWDSDTDTCRRRSPVASPPDGDAMWPNVVPDEDWCGEWNHFRHGPG